MTNLRFGTLIVLIGGMLGGTAHAQTSQLCAAAKLGALGKTAANAFNCYSKAAKLGVAVDAACLQKGEDKWNLPLKGSFQKAEVKGGCAIEGQSWVLNGRCSITTTKVCDSDLDCAPTATNGLCTPPNGIRNDDTEAQALYDLVIDEEATVTHPFPNGIIDEVVPVLDINPATANKCQSDKLKNTGKLAAALLGCHAKAAKSNVPVDQNCLAKVTLKHTQSFSKSELKPPCDTTGDAASVQAKLTPFVERALAGIPRNDGCGSGVVIAPETCDDGNTVNTDACPSDCKVDTCTPNTGTDAPFTVSFSSAKPVGAVTVFVDYPEGKVSLPGSGGSFPSGTYDFDSFAVQAGFNDFDHGVQATVSDNTGTNLGTTGALFTAHFETCSAAPAATPADFTCTVVQAADSLGKALTGVTCSVN